MRLVLIPGFGEDETIFTNIKPYLSYESVHVNVWEMIETDPSKPANVKTLALKLVEKFRIQATDLVIGHSMGGWIGWHIKEVSGCKLVQVSSWTDPQKVILPFQNRTLLYWLTRNGLYINRFTKSFLLNKFYKGQASKGIMEATLNNLIQKDKKQVLGQLQLILEPTKPCSAEPDLRIHTQRDPIIRRPDQGFFLVPGDHFAIYTYPKEVAKGILGLLS
jgi:hypothetical protein